MQHLQTLDDNWKKKFSFFPSSTAIFSQLIQFSRLFFAIFFIRRIYINILNQEYKVFYIGTNTGRIYKIVQFIQNGESKSTLLDIFEVAQNEAIQVMQISQKRKSLYVSTDHRIKQIDLAMCSRRYDSCFRCVKDPYCGWDEGTNSCKPYELGLLQVSFIASVLSYGEEKKLFSPMCEICGNVVHTKVLHRPVQHIIPRLLKLSREAKTHEREQKY